MDEIISLLENMQIQDAPQEPPKDIKQNKKIVWNALHSLYIENKRLKQYIKYILEVRGTRESIPEWVC